MLISPFQLVASPSRARKRLSTRSVVRMSEKSCKKSHRFPPLHAGGSTTGLSVADAWNRATVGNLAGVRPIMMVSDSIVGSDQGPADQRGDPFSPSKAGLVGISDYGDEIIGFWSRPRWLRDPLCSRLNEREHRGSRPIYSVGISQKIARL